MPLFQYFNRPTNLAFHDLTSRLSPPQNLRSLLGLGLKFIPTPYKTTLSAKLRSDKGAFPRLHRTIDLRCFFIDSPPLDPNASSMNYNPRMYIPSDWKPPFSLIPRPLSTRLSQFETTISSHFRCLKPIRQNLLRHQRFALESLRSQKDFLVVQCDKNLGPAVIEREEYIRLAFRDHLSDASTYRYLDTASVAHTRHRLFSLLRQWLVRYRMSLSKAERTFLTRLESQCLDPFPYFYLTMKVHKTPLKTRPIVSCTGSLLYGLGVWVDDKLQKIARLQKTYFKSSYDLKKELVDLPLPSTARLFTSDAISMYTNINTDAALREIARYLRRNPALCSDIPIEALLAALTLVMKNNVIQFGDTHWLQLQGAAMGTPPAPPYATLFYAIFEETLIREFASSIHLLRRYIDDIFGIWIPAANARDDLNDWNRFKARLSEFHGLEWETSERTTSVVFLDLTLTIRDNRITTSLYSKPLNLYLYIPPQSAHPPGVLNGLISGIIYRIYTLCSDPLDIRHRLQDFWNRLLARGYDLAKIRLPFEKGIANAKAFLNTTAALPAVDPPTPLFFHLQYHPQDAPSSVIQQAWKDLVALPRYSQPLASLPVRSREERGKTYPFKSDRLIVCYSRPPNLGNLLSYRKITSNSGPPVSSYNPRITGG
jgi:hypothetical protein